MFTSFVGAIDLLNFDLISSQYVPLCCSKSNNSDTPPECIEAENLGISVLSIQDTDNATQPSGIDSF